MKKTLAGIILGLLLSGVIYAAPLTDYSRGSAQVDFGVGYNSGSANDPNNSPSLSFGNGIAVNGAFTAGLSEELALRLRVLYSNSFSNQNTSGTSITVNSVITPIAEVLWQCITLERSPVALTIAAGFEAPCLSVASGNSSVFGPNYAPTLTFGLQAVAPINESVKVFANADFGLKATIAGVGVSYAVAKDADINIGVNAINYFPVYKDESAAIASRNITSLTPYCSLSYRFML